MARAPHLVEKMQSKVANMQSIKVTVAIMAPMLMRALIAGQLAE